MTIVFYKALFFPIYGQLAKMRAVLILCSYSILHNTLPLASINPAAAVMEQAQNWRSPN